MKLFLTFMLLTTSTLSFSAVVRSYDSEKACDLYRVVPQNTKIESNEEIIFSKEVYGIGFEKLEVDFDKREARVQVIMNVVLGVNRPLIDKKSIILAENPDFSFLINQINRKLFLLDEICLSTENRITYSKIYNE